MDEENFKKLTESFSSIYPEIYKKLEDIRKNVVNNKLNIIYDAKRAYLQKVKQDPNHTKCNGQLLSKPKTNMEGKKVQQCSKCHRWIVIDKK